MSLHRCLRLGSAIWLVSIGVCAQPVRDPVLDTPAMTSRLAAGSLFNGVAWAGDHAVAVGVRGHVLLSTPQGWAQAAMPTSADLTAVHFVSASTGWAVGQGGVVLRSTDGGRNWVRQLDGREAARLMVDYYKRAVAAGQRQNAAALAESERFASEGPGRPFLGVWFRDDKVGFVVGAFNLVFRTSDGGLTWEPWFDRTLNPNLYNLYAVTGDDHDVYIVGEQGLVLKLNAERQRFEALPVDYKGSFFGVVIPKPNTLLVYGLRGNVRWTADAGAHWTAVESNDPSAITGGAAVAGGKALLVSQSGRVMLFDAQTVRLHDLKIDRPMSYAGIAAAGAARMVLAGFDGVRIEAVPAAEPR